MSILEQRTGLRVRYASPWTPELGDTLRIAAMYWWDIVMPIVYGAPTHAARFFLDNQIAEHSPLNLGEHVSVTLPSGEVIYPGQHFMFYGYDPNSRVVVFRWTMDQEDQTTIIEQLDTTSLVEANEKDDAVFVLVQLSGEATAPGVLMVWDGSFTTNNLLKPEELRRLVEAAGL